jgi:uncharacterized membrane-anchored protein YhcB (DUF1043 family)
MVSFTSDQWVIVALVFVLGLLIGAFLTAGGRRKWKARYRDESDRREALERELRDNRAQLDEREKEWREQDSLRAAALKDRSGPTSRDLDADGVPDDVDRRPTDDRRA